MAQYCRTYKVDCFFIRVGHLIFTGGGLNVVNFPIWPNQFDIGAVLLLLDLVVLLPVLQDGPENPVETNHTSPHNGHIVNPLGALFQFLELVLLVVGLVVIPLHERHVAVDQVRIDQVQLHLQVREIGLPDGPRLGWMVVVLHPFAEVVGNVVFRKIGPGVFKVDDDKALILCLLNCCWVKRLRPFLQVLEHDRALESLPGGQSDPRVQLPHSSGDSRRDSLVHDIGFGQSDGVVQVLLDSAVREAAEQSGANVTQRQPHEDLQLRLTVNDALHVRPPEEAGGNVRDSKGGIIEEEVTITLPLLRAPWLLEDEEELMAYEFLLLLESEGLLDPAPPRERERERTGVIIGVPMLELLLLAELLLVMMLLLLLRETAVCGKLMIGVPHGFSVTDNWSDQPLWSGDGNGDIDVVSVHQLVAFDGTVDGWDVLHGQGGGLREQTHETKLDVFLLDDFILRLALELPSLEQLELEQQPLELQSLELQSLELQQLGLEQQLRFPLEPQWQQEQHRQLGHHPFGSSINLDQLRRTFCQRFSEFWNLNNGGVESDKGDSVEGVQLSSGWSDRGQKRCGLGDRERSDGSGLDSGRASSKSWESLGDGTDVS
ncbi:hypothetical protein WICPIJ_001425 [Wickerhamomyces pijperi]|uniref:Uncharacterized protein n=1 Tax=Wickerhamomyces pijperi TaxID=599730 RepID=A0A9P8QDE0_WICPI|nr:hypothetical protein WICPIJ_001425 [Wickerhamomyces pijperi]